MIYPDVDADEVGRRARVLIDMAEEPVTIAEVELCEGCIASGFRDMKKLRVLHFVFHRTTDVERKADGLHD